MADLSAAALRLAIRQHGAITTAQLGRPAPRPAYGVLRNLHLELSIGDSFPDWREALAAHLAEEGVTT